MFLRLVPTVGASVVSLWLAALVARPRAPLPGSEVQELVYARLLGGQHRLLLLAMVGTTLGLLALVLSVPSGAAALSGPAPPRQQICFTETAATSLCYTPQPGEAWVEERRQSDGTWRVIGLTFAAPRPPGEKDTTP